MNPQTPARIRRAIKRGDVEPVLNAFGTGRLIVSTRGQVDPSRADFIASYGSIRPFKGSDWDRRRFCAEDWHVLLAAWADGRDTTFDRKDAEKVIAPVTMSFTLDGQPLETTRTPIQPYLEPSDLGFEQAWYFQQGWIMPPDDPLLGAGEHQLSFTLANTPNPDESGTDGITFWIDPAGSVACIRD
jgi:hypothetical protein